MTSRHVRKTFANANRSVPPSMTDELVSRVQALRPSLSSDYLKATWLTKFVSSSTTPASERRQRAIDKWLATELTNAETNDRLSNYEEEYNILPRLPVGRFIRHCRNFILDILGEIPPEDALFGSFSGGASTSRNRTVSFPAGKYLGEAHATSRAAGLFSDLFEDMPVWFEMKEALLVKEVSGNVMFTVPKNADIDRPACKEPDLNMWLQKGMGDVIRSRLLRRGGINLNDQSINNRLAREGSLSGTLATIDLSSASDSVTSSLVELLLPLHWWVLLDTVRSPITIIDGVEHRNEMFSSMGNGFTFELESLLFFAIVKTVCYLEGIPGVVSVYGDDIICPNEAYDSVVMALAWFGFSVNSEKSFHTGSFRESCGGHYHDGVDITPFYLRKPLENYQDVIHVANALRSWCGRQCQLSILDPEVENIWLWLSSFIPKGLWGGTDHSRKDQLVAHGIKPMYRLAEETRKVSPLDQGAYLFWLNTIRARNEVAIHIVTSSFNIGIGKFRMKRVRDLAVTQLPQAFYSEVCCAEYVEGVTPH